MVLVCIGKRENRNIASKIKQMKHVGPFNIIFCFQFLNKHGHYKFIGVTIFQLTIQSRLYDFFNGNQKLKTNSNMSFLICSWSSETGVSGVKLLFLIFITSCWPNFLLPLQVIAPWSLHVLPTERVSVTVLCPSPHTRWSPVSGLTKLVISSKLPPKTYLVLKSTYVQCCISDEDDMLLVWTTSCNPRHRCHSHTT